MNRTALTLLVALALGGCTKTEDGLQGVGDKHASRLAESRFVRRAFLDLTSEPPSDAELAKAVDAIDAAGATAKSREALAKDLLSRPSFAKYYVAELEAKVFGGVPMEQEYQLNCQGVAATDAACAACPVAADDLCACTACASMKGYAKERDAMRKTADDLATGKVSLAKTGRRYAESRVFADSLGDPASIAASLFTTYLDKKISPEEAYNAKLLTQGALADGAMAGVLFHRVGGSYADLVDIVFSSEVYREATVNVAFERYLGRLATSDELRAFVPMLDAKDPDVRPVIALVIASQEYFTQ